MANHPLLLRSYYDDAKLKLIASKLQYHDASFQDVELAEIISELNCWSDFDLHQKCKEIKSLSSHQLNEGNK
jgi:hypothetical protein